MRRAILALACILACSVLPAQTVEIIQTWNDVATTEPRANLTLVVQVKNTLSDPQAIGLEVDLPAGWRRLVPDISSVVEPGILSVRILSLFVPQEAQAGEYNLEVVAVDPTTGVVHGKTDILVRVLPHLELQIDGLDGSTHVLAGELIELPFRVANRSNTALQVSLTLETRSFYAAEFVDVPGGQLTLASNESVRVVARVRTPSVISRVEGYSVDVVATGRPADGSFSRGGNARASFQAQVEIIPVVSEEPAPVHTIPARLQAETSHLFGPGWNGTLALDLAGGGYLDEFGRHRLDFRIAPSVDLDQPSFDIDDGTYRINYSTGLIDLVLGDNGHDVSPLLGNYREGRGILTRYKPGPFSIAGLYYFPPEVGPTESTVALLTDFRIPDSNLRSGYRYRTSLSGISLVGSDVLIGNYHEFYIGQDAGVEFDLAGGWTAATPFVWGARVGGGGAVADVQLTGTGFYTAPGFPGSNGDQVFIGATAATVLESIGLNLSANTSFREENLSRTGPVAPQSFSAAANGSLSLQRLAGQITAGWSLKTRKDLMPSPDFHQIDNSVTAATRIPLGNMLLSVDAKLDLDREVFFDYRTVGQRYGLGVRITPSPEVTHNINASIFGQRSTELPTNRRFTAGVSTTQDWGPVATVSRVGVSLSTRDGTFAALSSFLAAEAEVSVWGEHTITVDGFVQYDLDTQSSDVSGGFSIGYSAPVRVPTSRKRGIGSIEGYAFDAGSGDPAEGIVIRAADRAVVTGPEGVFRLSSLFPGEYFIDVDTSRFGRGLVPDMPLPIKIPIEADTSTRIDLPIVRAGIIRGSVVLYAPMEDRQNLLSTLSGDARPAYEEDELSQVGGLANIVVQASRGDEIRRILTDRDGNFLVSDLRPGRWVVRLSNPRLPLYHRLVEEEFELVLEAGEDRTVRFEIHPIRRPVTIIQTEMEPLVLQTAPSDDIPPRDQDEEVADVTTDPANEEDPAATSVVDHPYFALALERYSLPDPNAPRLLGLQWGSTPDEATLTLEGRIGELAPVEVTVIGVGTEEMLIRVFGGSGIFHLGLRGDIRLTFLDPAGDQRQMFLVGAEVTIGGPVNDLSEERLQVVLRDLIELYVSRWKVDESAGSDDREAFDTRTAGIDVSIVYDEVRNAITLDYRDPWYQESAGDLGEAR